MRSMSSGVLEQRTDLITFEADESFDVTRLRRLYRYTYVVIFSQLKTTARESEENLRAQKQENEGKRKKRYRLTSRFYPKRIISWYIPMKVPRQDHSSLYYFRSPLSFFFFLSFLSIACPISRFVTYDLRWRFTRHVLRVTVFLFGGGNDVQDFSSSRSPYVFL